MTVAVKGRKAVEKKSVALESLKIEYAPISSVHPNAYNPNRQSDHEFELLCRSMLEDGFTQPIIVLREGRVIVDGEHRWVASIVVEHLRRSKSPATHDSIIAARTQRMEILPTLNGLQIPVVLVDMTMEQARIATLRHNRARGSEDIELTAGVLRDLRELGALDWAQDSLMLTDVEMSRLLDDTPIPEALSNAEFSAAWTPAQSVEDETFTKVGGQVASMTPAAALHMREIEQRIAAAKTEEERIATTKDRQVYRVVCTFTDEEAIVVKAVLGDQPALAILRLCQEAHLRDDRSAEA